MQDEPRMRLFKGCRMRRRVSLPTTEHGRGEGASERGARPVARAKKGMRPLESALKCASLQGVWQ